MPYYRCAACGLTSYSAAAYSSASECPTCSAPLAKEGRLHVTPGTKRGVSVRLLARPEAAAEARRAVTGLALPDVTRGVLGLLVTELVTNSVRHAGLGPADEVVVRFTDHGASVRLSVSDPGAGFAPVAARPDDPLSGGGRGLLIVAALSTAWGVDRGADGFGVWCVVAVGEQGTAAVDRDVTAGYIHEMAREMARGGSAAG
jgi:anti-sigma regulatory factor (Ser/Thr protein kinase)